MVSKNNRVILGIQGITLVSLLGYKKKKNFQLFTKHTLCLQTE